jgi:hypothetical protein
MGQGKSGWHTFCTLNPISPLSPGGFLGKVRAYAILIPPWETCIDPDDIIRAQALLRVEVKEGYDDAV